MNGVEATPLLGGMKMHTPDDELWCAFMDAMKEFGFILVQHFDNPFAALVPGPKT
jgi:hypothetical protein